MRLRASPRPCTLLPAQAYSRTSSSEGSCLGTGRSTVKEGDVLQVAVATKDASQPSWSLDDGGQAPARLLHSPTAHLDGLRWGTDTFIPGPLPISVKWVGFDPPSNSDTDHVIWTNQGGFHMYRPRHVWL